MISFRYHLVSIVAVFLALGLGILTGTTVLNQHLVKNLKNRTKAAEQDVARYRQQVLDVQGQVSELQTFIQDARPFLIDGKLQGEQVVLLTQDGSDPAAVAEAKSALLDAGARVTSLDLTGRMALADPASQRDLAALLGLPADTSPQTLQATAARSLGDRLAGGPPATDLPQPNAPHDLLEGLLSKGFLKASSLTPAQVPQIGGPDQTFVVVGGGNSNPAVPLQSFLVPLVAQLGQHTGVPVAAGESTATTTFPFVSLLRGDSQLDSDPMVTVDDLDPDHAGGVALVLGLRNLLLTGQGGNYGLKDGNDGILPKAA
ncbi:MAG: copper transporter [Actinomycetota bacterium]|nr:copper transporter [Actinomycetota bacterium]